MTPNQPASTASKTFHCYICKETSTSICAHCTRDTCELHLCERCKRCTDCCACHLDQQKRR